jgi:hypothetical protein
MGRQRFKVTAKGEMNVRDLDQLLGYYLLARNQRHLDSTFPEIKRAALYFCRHGHLWSLDATIWTEHSAFTEIEKWFFERANEAQKQATESLEKLKERLRHGLVLKPGATLDPTAGPSEM